MNEDAVTDIKFFFSWLFWKVVEALTYSGAAITVITYANKFKHATPQTVDSVRMYLGYAWLVIIPTLVLFSLIYVICVLIRSYR